MMVLDGMTNDGAKGHTNGVWNAAVTRYSLNYTDVRKWVQYKNRKGEIQEFVYQEINGQNTYKPLYLTSGYVKFDPQMITRSVRVIILSYRKYPTLIVEFFGCYYFAENQGLQKVDYWSGEYKLRRKVLFRYQMDMSTVSIKKGRKRYRLKDNTSPAYQPFLKLSQRQKYTCDNSKTCKSCRINVNLWHPYNRGSFYLRNSFWLESWKIKRLEDVGKQCTSRTGIIDMAAKTICDAKELGKPHKFHYIPFSNNKPTRIKGCSSTLIDYGHTYCKIKKFMTTPYFEFDLKKISVVDSILFKGHSNRMKDSYVSVVAISYSTDYIVWLPLKKRYGFDAYLHKSYFQYARFVLDPRIRARYLRIKPVRGENKLCFRVKVTGCTKEPWLDEMERLKTEAKRTGFRLWHIQLGKPTKPKKLPISCFPKDLGRLKTVAVSTEIYEIIQDQELLWPKEKALIFEKIVRERYLKCVARDENGEIVSLQVYIITPYAPKTGTIVPIQDVGLMSNGGMPIFANPGTVWTYEPLVGKLTFLFFTPMTYRYQFFGLLDKKNAFDHFYLTYVGRGYVPTCMKHAVKRNCRYFVVIYARCFTSWYLPYSPMTKARARETPARDQLWVIRVIQTRVKYKVQWRRAKTLLGTYYIGAEAKWLHPVYQTLPTGMGKYQFYYDSYVTTRTYDSHTLVVHYFEQKDVDYYQIYITQHRKTISRATNLRHYSRPRLSFPPSFGACLGEPLVIAATPIRGDYQQVNEWAVTWYKVVNGKDRRLPRGLRKRGRFGLRAKKASTAHAGRYKTYVKDIYGLLTAETEVKIITRLPKITWVTLSPHTAVEDTSDILQVTVANEHDLIAVEWKFEDDRIDFEDDHFTFPGAVADYPQTRKILKLNNMNPKMSGSYTVITKTKYCEYSRKILVEVYVRPKLIVSPNFPIIYQLAGGNTTEIKVVVAGGFPEPQIDNLFWYKGNKLLQATQKGRIRVRSVPWIDIGEKSPTKGKMIAWNATLSIFEPHESDSGTYSFMVSFPKTNYTIQRVVKVTRITDL